MRSIKKKKLIIIMMRFNNQINMKRLLKNKKWIPIKLLLSQKNKIKLSQIKKFHQNKLLIVGFPKKMNNQQNNPIYIQMIYMIIY